MVWLETPTNPLMKLANIEEVSNGIKSISRSDVILVVDNTFLTCYFQVNFLPEKSIKIWETKLITKLFLQRPLDLGADIVMYSLTKYMNGHSDVIMGAAITKRDDLEQRLRFIQNGTLQI